MTRICYISIQNSYPKLANNNNRKQGQKNEGFFAYIGLQCHFHHHPPLPLAFPLHAC